MNINAETIINFLNTQQHHITHVAVVHTKLHTYQCNDLQIARMAENARKQCKHFRNVFNQFLYQAKSHRKPMLYQPLMLTTIEGAHTSCIRAHTIHFNFALGNIPQSINTDELKQVLHHCWVVKANGGKDLWLKEAEPGKNIGWTSYATKEAERGNIGTWDFTNTQIPYAALDADLS